MPVGCAEAQGLRPTAHNCQLCKISPLVGRCSGCHLACIRRAATAPPRGQAKRQPSPSPDRSPCAGLRPLQGRRDPVWLPVYAEDAPPCAVRPWAQCAAGRQKAGLQGVLALC